MELLLVLTILAILAGIVIPSIARRGPEARIVAAKTAIANFVSALSMYEVDTGAYPKGSEGLQALVAEPRDPRSNWKGPYIQKDKVPLDPWKNPYIYEIPGKHNPKSYDLYSKGIDGLGGTNVIGNWTMD